MVGGIVYSVLQTQFLDSRSMRNLESFTSVAGKGNHLRC